MSPDLLNRCVEAYVGVYARRMGEQYDGPSALEIVQQEGLDINAVPFGDVTDRAEQLIVERYAKGHTCPACGRAGLKGERSMARHRANWCPAGDPQDGRVAAMLTAGATYNEIQSTLRVDRGRIARVVERARREGAA